MITDVHAHYWTDDYLDLVAGLGKSDTDTQRGMGAGGGTELQDRLRLMQRSGVDTQILSACPQMPYSLDVAAARDTARFVNDQYIDLSRQHPGRFQVFAALPLPDVRASLAEIARISDQPEVKGFALNTTVLGVKLIDESFLPIFDELNRRGAVVFIHPSGECAQSPLMSAMAWMVGAPVEDTVSIFDLLTAGYPSRFERITFINSHLGGAMPMLARRWNNGYRWEAPSMPEPPQAALRRMYYDTVGHGHTPALIAAVDTVGADRVVLGTDFPYETGDAFAEAVDFIREAPLSTPQIDDILTNNVAALIK